MKRQYFRSVEILRKRTEKVNERSKITIFPDIFWLKERNFSTTNQCPLCCKKHRTIKTLIPCAKLQGKKENPEAIFDFSNVTSGY